MIPHSRTFIEESDRKTLIDSLDKGILTANELNRLFAERFAEYIGCKYVRLTVSGTTAFYRILLAYGLGPGDEIAIPDYICSTLLGPIKALGIIPKIYDNAHNSWITSIDEIMKVVGPRTKCLLINHTFGIPFQGMEELGNRLGNCIKIIEDCCHRIIPHNFDDFPVCKHSHCAFYSFNATKLLATGEGGAIASNDHNFLQKLDETYIGDQLSDLNSALGLSQLDQMPSFLSRRKEISERYLEYFSEYIPKTSRECGNAYFRFPILVENDSLFMENKKVAYRKGVDTLLSHSLLIPHQPNAWEQMRKTVSIPIYPSLTDQEQEIVIEETLNILKNGN